VDHKTSNSTTESIWNKDRIVASRIEIGLIRVISTQEPAVLDAHGTLIENKYPGLRVRSACIPDHPTGIYDQCTEQSAIAAIIRIGNHLAALGCHAIIVSCANDPGVFELRQQLTIPIIGAGSAAACLARSLTDRIGVISIVSSSPPVMTSILGNTLIGTKKPAGINTTLDLASHEAFHATLVAARQLSKAGARALVLACTGYSTIQAAPLLQKRIHIPVIDPVLAAGWTSLHAIRETHIA